MQTNGKDGVILVERLSRFLCIFLLSFTIIGCAQGTQSTEKIAPTQKIGDRPAKPMTKAEWESARLPDLAGGSEYSTRDPHPVSNQLLERKYPGVISLKGSENSNMVALTFDDGPDRRFTPQVLDVLKKHNVKATFFLMGSRVRSLPTITQRIHEEGHAVGNHTYWHPNLLKVKMKRLHWEVKETEKAIYNTIGHRTKLFRAPYGNLDENQVQAMANMGYRIIGWSVDSLDWRQLPKKEVTQNVLSNSHPGAIILMHSGGHWTQDLSGMVAALDEIIPRLKKDGMHFVTIPELLNIPPYKKEV